MKSAAKSTTVKELRCAIYTRKSTEHNLDLTFNSLDAQREACEAYIKSQAHEGWRLIPDHFDDGAFSGASLDRPALQSLLEVVRSRKGIVVYKVDRLTRSLADFAKLVELFDEHRVSFVSVTQSFNTTSSMGRLTLNVLLSFAQFEREVIGERVRDKIAASKRKGLWVGGPIPLGYRSVNKKLEIIPEEANLVRRIYEDYLRLDSIAELAASLNSGGIKPKPRRLANGSSIAAEYFRVGPLAHLLKNRFYIGEIVYRGEIHKGEQEPILDPALFDAVQARLAQGRTRRKIARSKSPAILTGLIFDDRGNRMTPSHINKKGVRYRYYVSQALLQNRKSEAGSVARVPAPEVETLVSGALRKLAPKDLAGSQRTEVAIESDDRELVCRCVERIDIQAAHLVVTLRDAHPKEDRSSVEAEASSRGKRELGTDAETLSQPQLTIPFTPNVPPQKGVAHTPADPSTLDTDTRDAPLRTIARAHGWMDTIFAGTVGSFEEIAMNEGLGARHVRFLSRLAFLSPRIIEAIANGSIPAGATASSFARALPFAWIQQERQINLGLS